jgi:hypothetical protein
VHSAKGDLQLRSVFLPAVCSALLLAGIATAEFEATIPIALTPNQHLLLFGLLWWFDS